MIRFRYQALDAEGKLVAGELQAESASLAVRELERSALRVRSIAQAELEPASAAVLAPAAVSADDAAIENHLQAAMERGKLLAPALRAYAEELPSGRRRRELMAMLRVLDGGVSPQSLAEFKKLPGWWIPLLSSASKSLDPGRMLQEFLNESRRADELRRQWWLSIAYPLLIAVLAAAVMTVLSVFVIPIFRDIFLGFGLKLPMLTATVLWIAEWIASGRILFSAAIVLVAALLVLGAIRLLPSAVQEWIGSSVERLRGRAGALARFSNFTAELLEADADTRSAVRLAGFVTNSTTIRRASSRLADDWESNRLTPTATHRSPLGSTILYALQAELPKNGRARLLAEISACHAQRVRHTYSWTRGIVEPAALIVVGTLVGLTVVALFLPLFSLVQGLT